MATRDDALAKGLGFSIIGITVQEGHDPWDEAKMRRGAVGLPVADGHFVYTEFLS